MIFLTKREEQEVTSTLVVDDKLSSEVLIYLITSLQHDQVILPFMTDGQQTKEGNIIYTNRQTFLVMGEKEHEIYASSFTSYISCYVMFSTVHIIADKKLCFVNW